MRLKRSSLWVLGIISLLFVGSLHVAYGSYFRDNSLETDFLINLHASQGPFDLGTMRYAREQAHPFLSYLLMDIFIDEADDCSVDDFYWINIVLLGLASFFLGAVSILLTGNPLFSIPVLISFALTPNAVYNYVITTRLTYPLHLLFFCMVTFLWLSAFRYKKKSLLVAWFALYILYAATYILSHPLFFFQVVSGIIFFPRFLHKSFADILGWVRKSFLRKALFFCSLVFILWFLSVLLLKKSFSEYDYFYMYPYLNLFLFLGLFYLLSKSVFVRLSGIESSRPNLAYTQRFRMMFAVAVMMLAGAHIVVFNLGITGFPLRSLIPLYLVLSLLFLSLPSIFWPVRVRIDTIFSFVMVLVTVFVLFSDQDFVQTRVEGYTQPWHLVQLPSYIHPDKMLYVYPSSYYVHIQNITVENITCSRLETLQFHPQVLGSHAFAGDNEFYLLNFSAIDFSTIFKESPYDFSNLLDSYSCDIIGKDFCPDTSCELRHCQVRQ